MRALSALVAALLASIAAGQDDERVRRLLADLESPEWQVREDATAALIEVGLEGEAAILAARESGSHEVRSRLDRVLAAGFLGALREPRARELVERWWEGREEEIAGAFAGRVPLVDRPERFAVVPDRSHLWGDWRKVYFPASRVVGDEEPELRTDGAVLLCQRTGVHRRIIYVLEPATAALLARTDGTRVMSELGGSAALCALLVLGSFDVVEWAPAPMDSPGEPLRGLVPVDAVGEPGVRYVVECFVGE